MRTGRWLGAGPIERISDCLSSCCGDRHGVSPAAMDGTDARRLCIGSGVSRETRGSALVTVSGPDRYLDSGRRDEHQIRKGMRGADVSVEMLEQVRERMLPMLRLVAKEY